MFKYKILLIVTNFIKLISIIPKKLTHIFSAINFITFNQDYGKYKSNVINFENKFKQIFFSQYSITFSSATAAFDSLISTFNFPKGTKVLSTELIFNTFFLNIISREWKIDFLKLDKEFKLPNSFELINSDYKIILLTHPFGIIQKFEKIRKFAKENNILIIEDCSHAIGGQIDYSTVGIDSDFRIFSIGGKMISGGEGGVLLTNDKTSYNKLIISSHPFRSEFQTNIENQFYHEFSSPKKNRINPINAIFANYDLKNFTKKNFIINKNITNFNKLIDKINFSKNIIEYIKPEKNVTYGGFFFGYPIRINDKNVLKKLLKFSDIFLTYPWIDFKNLNSIYFQNNEFFLKRSPSDEILNDKDFLIFINYKYLTYNYLSFKIFFRSIFNDI